ncbi:MAG: hypothetical protein DHS20C14_18240 [Phycisphaeraceae bacterium]|nr:MAG: hypothetical protein DHS20C14_18240 [Phycisphaeraceae bacterium]
MGTEFEIRTVRQLRALTPPARREVVEALLDRARGGEGVPAREIAVRAGLSIESTHYHLGELAKIGILKEVGQRPTGARPEKLFSLTCDRIELKRGKRSPAYVRELVRAVRLMLRRAEREYADASPDGTFVTRPRIARSIAWMTPEDVEEIAKLNAKIEQIARGADKRAHDQGLGGRERVAVTTIISPTDRPSEEEQERR